MTPLWIIAGCYVLDHVLTLLRWLQLQRQRSADLTRLEQRRADDVEREREMEERTMVKLKTMLEQLSMEVRP